MMRRIDKRVRWFLDVSDKCRLSACRENGISWARRRVSSALSHLAVLALVWMSGVTVQAETHYLISDFHKAARRFSVDAMVGSTLYAVDEDQNDDLYLYRMGKFDQEFTPYIKIAGREDKSSRGVQPEAKKVAGRLLVSYTPRQEGWNSIKETHFLLDEDSDVLTRIFAGQYSEFQGIFRDRLLFYVQQANTEGYGLFLFDPANLTSRNLSAPSASGISSVILGATNSKLFFTRDSDSSQNRELWVADETANPPQKLATLPRTHSVAELGAVGEVLVFRSGETIWSSDGTVAGTRLVLDIASQDPLGLGESYRTIDSSFAVTPHGSVFMVQAEQSGDDAYDKALELWVTNGTSAGTRFLKGLRLGQEQWGYADIIEVNDQALWSVLIRTASGATAELWTADGTADGTKRMLAGDKDVYLVTNRGNRERGSEQVLIVSVSDDSSELYVSRGTQESTTRLGSFNWPLLYADFGSEMFFSDEPAGEQGARMLWRTDGSAEGTVLVRSAASGEPIEFEGYSFHRDESTAFAAGELIWDIPLGGSTATTRGYTTSSAEQFTRSASTKLYATHADRFLLSAWPSNLNGLLAATGLPEDFTQIAPASPIPAFDFEDRQGPYFTMVEDNIFFLSRAPGEPEDFGFSTDYAVTLHRIDLTLQGVRDLGTFGAGCITPCVSVGRAGERFLLGAVDSSGRALFSTTGTVSGMHRMDLDVDLGTSFAQVGSNALVSDWDRNVWTTDGTPGGTRLSDMPRSNLEENIALNGIVYFLDYFTDEQGGSRRGLWRTNGTKAGTALVKDLNYESIWWGGLAHFTVFEGAILFLTESEDYKLTLWRSDGSALGTQPIKVWDDASSELSFISLASSGVFIGVDLNGINSPAELWRTDGTSSGTTRLRRWEQTESGLGKPVALGNTVYFTAWNADGITPELWKSNGTPEGTVVAIDGAAVSFRDMEKELLSNRDTVVFIADDGVVGMEPWAITTRTLQDNCPSDPRKLEPGVCGCGRTELDLNWDGIVDCGDRSGIAPTPTPTPTPTATLPPSGEQDGAHITGMSVNAPILRQQKTSIVVSMQEIPGVSYQISGVVIPPKAARASKKKNKPKTITVLSDKPQKSLGAFKVGTKLSVSYRVQFGAHASAQSGSSKITVKKPKKTKK